MQVLLWWLTPAPAGVGLEHAIDEAQSQNRCTQATDLPVGFADRGTTLRTLQVLAQRSDVILLGIPFADGLMDGPEIQEAFRYRCRRRFSHE
ncbi:tryptophan synthase subunit alpha [Streptomyces sp. NPDC048508]|uniref:tryptophan synthase subunit alpha n=1 Tax=Streptomyces sp. NPDC048508 TaxID=3365561 RepID=UPI003713FE42